MRPFIWQKNPRKQENISLRLTLVWERSAFRGSSVAREFNAFQKGSTMPLELRKTSQWWYGRYQANGKIHCINLGIRVEGKRPDSLLDHGDTRFERSRGRAQEALDRILLDMRRQKTEQRLLEQLYEIRTGNKVKRVPLSKIEDAWEEIPRKRPPSTRYVDQCRSTLARLRAFLGEHHPSVTDVTQITKDMATAYLKWEADRGVSESTWNDILKTVRGCLRHTLPAFHTNPFSGIPLRETQTIHRKPYTVQELQQILSAVKDDDFIRPLIITAMCTAMRRGDCCMLQWEQVDLAQRFLSVKTSKTGETVEIPIFPLLHDELQRWIGKSDTYVFPEQAGMFQTNPDGVSYRISRALHKAGFIPRERHSTSAKKAPPQLERKENDEIKKMAKSAIGPMEGKSSAHRKKRAILKALDLYLDGRNVSEVGHELGLSKGCVSNYLNRLENICGVAILRRKDGNLCRPEDVAGPKHVTRSRGLRKASLRDFHSFRVTWITAALSAGVPMELVKKVTGHRTADIVLKHYFKPGRAQLSRALDTAMPELLQGVPTHPEHTVEDLVRQLSADNWGHIKGELEHLLNSRSELGKNAKCDHVPSSRVARELAHAS